LLNVTFIEPVTGAWKWTGGPPIARSPVNIPVKFIVEVPDTGGAVHGVKFDSTALVTVFGPTEYSVAPV
jgi:hypothetical protein